MKSNLLHCGLLILVVIALAILPVSATKPSAEFLSNISDGTAPLSVQFIDSSTNTPTSWAWLFGDGGSSTEQNPVHTYRSEGEYTVTLTATNSDGSSTETQSGYIAVIKEDSAPVAGFVSTATTGSIPFSVQFVDSSTNNPSSWAWSFGDGGTSDEQNPTHIYKKAGTFAVTLTATNSAGSNTVSKSNFITATKQSVAPEASFVSTKTSGTSPFTVQFMDSSTNTPSSWVWSFGDGSTSTLQAPSHTYVNAGTYTVTLTATNAAGSDTHTENSYISVTLSPPATSFTTNATSGVVPFTVAFTDTSTNSPTSWYWKFGDGTTNSTRNPVYTYDEIGTYIVTLTSTNSAGSNVSAETKTITVTRYVERPAASFTSVTSGTNPLMVTFTDTSTNSPTSWAWSFGDGTHSSVQNPTHTYSIAGTYTVSLTSSNTGGSADSVGYVTVSSVVGATATTQATVAPTEEIVTVTPTETPIASGSSLPSWLLPLVGIVAVILVIIVIFALASSRSRGRSGGRYRGRDL
ncbi:MAG: PKD domain-containing protein [Methanoregula sp.]